MKTAIIIFPGSNCDRDIKVAIKFCTGIEPLMIWHEDKLASKIDLVIIPGGFSYGDYLRSGSIAAQSPIMEDIVLKSNQGLPVVGICNGFQILTEAGLLPGALIRNSNLNFICKNSFIKIENKKSIFSSKFIDQSIISLPIAHKHGNYFASDKVLKNLEENDRVIFRYCDEKGLINNSANPNGSKNNIAGIINDKGNILGMMPHPERSINASFDEMKGLNIFKSLYEVLL
ncbi:phosphoribosylformylglycinamidine synthase subunit PurQ [Alphaproteobacteria bacterium]|nr:phosphoribosylformylglycinamidine synthase subunit PurQ [Alphaproteobacteria bacterium]